MESHKSHVPNHQPVIQGYPSVEVKTQLANFHQLAKD
jgi:hypothetical protein